MKDTHYSSACRHRAFCCLYTRYMSLIYTSIGCPQIFPTFGVAIALFTFVSFLGSSVSPSYLRLPIF